MVQLVCLVHVTPNMTSYFVSGAKWNQYVTFSSHLKSRPKGLVCCFSKTDGNGGLWYSEHGLGTFSIITLDAVFISSFHRLDNRSSDNKELVMFTKCSGDKFKPRSLGFSHSSMLTDFHRWSVVRAIQYTIVNRASFFKSKNLSHIVSSVDSSCEKVNSCFELKLPDALLQSHFPSQTPKKATDILIWYPSLPCFPYRCP